MKNEGIKIFIVGAGATASVICRYLLKEPWISEISCGFKRGFKNRARQFIPYQNKKVVLTEINLENFRETVKKIKKADLIINAASYFLNSKTMGIALKAGANYLDSASWLHPNPFKAEQLFYDSKFRKAGLLGLIDTGLAPGLSNLLVREGADELDEVESIKIRLLEDIKAKEIISSWSPELVIDEMAAKPIVYKNRRFYEEDVLSGGELYEFPGDSEKKYVYSINQEEVATIPLYIKTNYLDIKAGGSEIDLARIFYKIGLFNKKAVRVKGRSIIPIEFLLSILPPTPTPNQMKRKLDKGIIDEAKFIIVVELLGKKFKKKILSKIFIVFPNLKEMQRRMPGSTYISYPTGIAAAIFAKNLKDIKRKGVIPPEALDQKIRKKILIELESNGITVSKEYKGI